MISASKKYKGELKRVKNTEKMNVVKNLRETKAKDVKSFWNILKGANKSNEIPVRLQEFYEHFKALNNEDEAEPETVLSIYLSIDNGQIPPI